MAEPVDPSCQITNCRNALKTAALTAVTTTYSFGASAVLLGVQEFDPTTGEFFDELRKEVDDEWVLAPKMVILPGACRGRGALGTGQHGTISIPCRLWLGLDKAASHTMEAEEKFVEAIILAMFAGSLSPSTIDVEEPEIQHHREQGAALYRFSVEFLDP